MTIADNFMIDSTSSALDYFNSPYAFSAPPREPDDTNFESQVVYFPEITQQTIYISSIEIERENHLQDEGEIALPEIRTIGKAILNVRKVTRLAPPEI